MKCSYCHKDKKEGRTCDVCGVFVCWDCIDETAKMMWEIFKWEDYICDECIAQSKICGCCGEYICPKCDAYVCDVCGRTVCSLCFHKSVYFSELDDYRNVCDCCW
ncbi:MAG: hypothetical protein ACO2PO_21410 [Candidatus Calescibacterium sp.]